MGGPAETDALPAEILHEIALHIPTVADITSFSLMDHYTYDSLMVPSLYAHRVASRGWDVESCKKHYPMVDGNSETIATWKKIDYIHESLEDLLDNSDVSDTFKMHSEGLGRRSYMDAEKLPIELYIRLLDVLTPILIHNCKSPSGF